MLQRFLKKLGFGPSRLESQRQWGITRLDRLDVYINVLMDAHPELRKHPSIIEFHECEEAWRREVRGL